MCTLRSTTGTGVWCDWRTVHRSRGHRAVDRCWSFGGSQAAGDLLIPILIVFAGWWEGPLEMLAGAGYLLACCLGMEGDLMREKLSP